MWVDVFEGEALVVFVDDVGGYFAVDDFAEYGFFAHDIGLFGNEVA